MAKTNWCIKLGTSMRFDTKTLSNLLMCWKYYIYSLTHTLHRSLFVSVSKTEYFSNSHSQAHRHFLRKSISMYVHSMHSILFLDNNLRACLLLNVQHPRDTQKSLISAKWNIQWMHVQTDATELATTTVASSAVVATETTKIAWHGVLSCCQAANDTVSNSLHSIRLFISSFMI